MRKSKKSMSKGRQMMPDTHDGYCEFEAGMRVVMIEHTLKHKVHIEPGCRGKVSVAHNMEDDGCSAVAVLWDDGRTSGHTVPPDLLKIDGMSSTVMP